MKNGALAGVRVLEIGQIILGPFTAQCLADMGADVVKIEPIGGEGSRVLGAFTPGESKIFHTLNRGKRGIELNMQTAEAQAFVHKIIPEFDVFIINSRVGVAERMNIDYETLKKLNPSLVYFEATGYGDRGPSAQRSGSDIVAQAYSGLMLGDRKIDATGAPDQVTALAPGDYSAGLSGAIGVCAALFHRERTGEGQKVTGSLLQSALAVQGSSVGKLEAFDKLVTNPMLERMQAVTDRGGNYAELLEAKGDMMTAMGASMRLYYGGYNVKDGAIILGALTPANRDQMRRALGMEDEPTGAPDFDPYSEESRAVGAKVFEEIKALMLTKTMDEWLELFDAEGAPVSKVNYAEKMFEDPQVVEMGYMQAYDHPVTGPEIMPGPVVSMSKTPTGTETPSPGLGQHSEEVFKEFGLSDADIEALRAAGATA